MMASDRESRGSCEEPVIDRRMGRVGGCVDAGRLVGALGVMDRDEGASTVSRESVSSRESTLDAETKESLDDLESEVVGLVSSAS